ncbi:hypothetical protein LCGC14_1368700 [marine sediment metagenome]|uniref:Uncharacterized protein n=1 Tax=marine sediment metagenome TaxID=412755 RepID=A0A0F9KRZ5_9ZZZZ
MVKGDEKFNQELIKAQRDMAYRFIVNHNLWNKYSKWWDKNW